MRYEWELAKLNDCATFQEGYVNPSQKIPDFFDGGIKWLRAVDLNDGVVRDTTRTLTEKGFKSAGKSSVLFEPGTLAISKSGTIGRLGFLNDYMCGNRAVINIKVNDLIADKKYIFYVLKSKRHEIESLATGSVQKNLYTSVLGSLQFWLPPLEVQERIGSILLSLDAKSDVNNQINQTLEQIVQAFFKSWFVDFDPVRAKMAALESGGTVEDTERAAMRAISGKSEAELDTLRIQNPDQYNSLARTAALFPSAMVESELGEIPEGWLCSTVGAEFAITMGQSPPGNTYNEIGEGMPFFQGRRDFGDRFPTNRVFCTQPKMKASEGDTLLSVRAPVGEINLAGSDCCIGRGIASIRHKSGFESFTYYSVMNLAGALKAYEAEGTVFGSINQKNLKALRVLNPGDDLVSAFDSFAAPMDAQIKILARQRKTLDELRDALLPKLLSGELSVPEVEEQTPETADV